jgi:hypothetical protein
MAVRRGILIATALAALVVFAVVQDRVTAAGARRYVELQRAALAGGAHPVTVDEIMRPAVSRSVREGLLWGGVVFLSGVGLAVAFGRHGAARRDPGSGIRDPQILAGAARASDPGSRIPDPGQS